MGKRRPAQVEPPSLPDTLVGAFADHSVDLHGFTEREALRRVDSLLNTWTRRQPGAVVKIVTGKGNRSASGPVLLNAVGNLLRDEVGRRVEDISMAAGGGGWMIRIGRP